jgi:hypothetical protein
MNKKEKHEKDRIEALSSHTVEFTDEKELKRQKLEPPLPSSSSSSSSSSLQLQSLPPLPLELPQQLAHPVPLSLFPPLPQPLTDPPPPIPPPLNTSPRLVNFISTLINPNHFTNQS